MSQVPTLQTKRLILKELTLEHAPSYQKHFANWEVIGELSSLVPWPYPADGAATYIGNIVAPQQGKQRWMWGLFLKNAPEEFIGSIELLREGKPEHRAFWLAHAHWGKGYMTEAAEAVTTFAFEEVGFETLVFANAVGNTRSRRVKEKQGARLLRVEPAGFVNPEYTEHEVWELTKEEWQKRR